MSQLAQTQDVPAPLAENAKQCVSVVIVSYWTGPLLVRSVLSAFRQAETAEVIVVDNGNWPNEMDRLREFCGPHADKLRVVSGHGNVGFAKGCNLGARLARYPYLFILNPDAILPKDALSNFIKESENLEGHWVIGPKLINPDGTEQAGSRRNPLTPWSAFVEMTGIYRLAPKHPYFRRFNSHMDPCPEETVEMPVISGASMFMKRDTYIFNGGMDEDYFLHVEDVDFCLRLKEAGGAVYFTPQTDILHYKSSSRASRAKVEIRKGHSLVKYFWRHFKEPYPWAFLVFVSACVWAGTALRVMKITIWNLMSLLGFRVRTGRQKFRRAFSISARKNSR